MTGTANDWNPLVSVIINCYNGQEYLRMAIESVFSQTYTNWEIVFWDNASTDTSAAIAQGFGERVRYFRGSVNIPLGAARNKAMEQTRGELIGFLDCDDIWSADKLEKQVHAMAGGYALCYGGVTLIDAAGTQIGTDLPGAKAGALFEQLLRQFDINLPTAMISKRALADSGLVFDGNVKASEEYCLFMQLAVGRNFICLGDTLAKYRIHEGALTNKSIDRWADEREYTLQRIIQTNPGIQEKFPAAFREAWARGRYYRARYFVHQGEKGRARKEMYRNIPVDYRYLVLWGVLWLPAIVWTRLHERKSHRKAFN